MMAGTHPAPVRLGIDLGGTKTEIIALGNDDTELIRRRVATPSGDYRATLNAIGELVVDVERELAARDCTIGIGTPGSISARTGFLRGSNSICLNGQPIKRDLEAVLGRRVRITNDANCFALSEAKDGAGRGATIVFGVILGTGVGGGVVVEGRVLEGVNGIAGEWGHNPLPWPNDDERPGPPCYCKKAGCIETFLSGPGLERDHRSVTGESATAQEIARRAAGDATCAATLSRYEERLARALAHVVNVLDPDAIVLGGGLSNIERLYSSVPKLWGRWIFSDAAETALLCNMHGDSSGVRGAARLWDKP
jgi:fructokinase